jgi:membrane protein
VIGRAARLAWRALNRFWEHSGPDRAAAVAYYTLLSLLPLLIFLISAAAQILGSFDAAYRATFAFFRGVIMHMDQASQEALRAFVERSVRFQWPGILVLAWTGRRTFASLFSALDAVFERPSRSFAKGNLVALAMVTLTGIGVLATMAFSMALATAEGVLRRVAGENGSHLFEGFGAFLWTDAFPAAVTFTFFFILYRFAPRQVRTRDAVIGALVASVLWEAAKAVFAFYVRDLAHYAGLYGALEGVIVLGLWLELSVSIILYGGEIVALTTLTSGASAGATPAPKVPPPAEGEI